MKPRNIYKIRHKPSNTFISLGYAGRSTWLTRPRNQIKDSITIQNNPEDYELVIYETKEISTKSIIKL